jgi:AcrR family transcriptional regulator
MARTTASASRAAILSAAAAMFISEGYNAATLADIGERVGLTRAALLYHFASKEEILQSITDPLFAEMEERLSGAEPVASPTRETQRRYLETMMAVLLEHRAAAELTHRFTTSKTALDIGARLTVGHEDLMRLLMGTDRAHDPVARVRANIAVAAIVGSIASRVSIPLATEAEREAVIEAAMCALAPVTTD